MWPFDEVMNCMHCNNELNLKQSSYWVVPGSGGFVYCEICFNGKSGCYVHPPVHYTKGVCDKEE